MTEEWTFVSHNKGSKQRNMRRRNAPHNGSGSGNKSGLYRAKMMADFASSSPDDGDDGMERFFDNQIEKPQQSQQQYPTEADKMRDRNRIKDAILITIDALEKRAQQSSSFSSRLLAALRDVTCNKDNKEGEDSKQQCSILGLREIVAYGIGNFAPTTTSTATANTTSTSLFSAPLLQLACLLFLRRHSCCSISKTASEEEDKTSPATSIDNESVFKKEQSQVPIYYYEPCILPIETELLEDVFHVCVLKNNEFGKLHVHSMRREQEQDGVGRDDVTYLDPSATATRTKQAGRQQCPQSKTLFYMPHCPMRLYCNVLWSHWDQLDTTIIFGNSFHSYDERILSSERRKDRTNGMFQILNCTNEIPVIVSKEDVDNFVGDGALIHLENAFNDCNVISFTVDNDGNSIAVDRPDEYFTSQDPDNKELL
jgi:hypothetical protein